MGKINVGLMLKGMAMGIAEVIPGVSGGTIAFITGIYEQLINSIKAFGPEALKGFQTHGFKGFWEAIDGDFLVRLIAGMVVGIVIGIFGVSYLLEHYPEPLWGFFFGLILASAVVIARQIENWNVQLILAFVIGVLIAYGITILSPAEGSTHPLYIFISGTLAISALLLPGISGSFILLLMGMYTIIIPTLKDVLRTFDPASLAIIGIFAAGCLTGLLGFSRILSWLFTKYKDLCLALLTGFIIGALNKVWPWRNVSMILDKDSGERIEVLDLTNFGNLNPDNYKILSEVNCMPNEYMMGESLIMWTILCTFAGLIGVFMLGSAKN
ncbi:MAG: DUF368 domain-containing protein [Saprospiraceae bacterium]|nr:DUF368 domain-containing protein [Saprospiraceae bacterium]